jgi:hypothetical protein
MATKRSMGLAPQEAEEGDFVCILLGCSVPVILRKRAFGQLYQCIGEAYVHGMVEGEEMEYLRKGERELRYFLVF